MKCFDSSFLADYTRGREAAIRYLEDRTDEELVVPTIALYESFTGRLKMDDEVKVEDFERAFDWATEVELTERHAFEAARVRRELTERGRRIQHPDMLLAGIARSLDAPVVTSDGDFERVDGLRLENHRKSDFEKSPNA
jgi:predicted nucleic acid-binding protein